MRTILFKCESERLGIRRLNQRSRRMPASSAVTAIVRAPTLAGTLLRAGSAAPARRLRFSEPLVMGGHIAAEAAKVIPSVSDQAVSKRAVSDREPRLSYCASDGRAGPWQSS